MSRIFNAGELEALAMFWRICRRDGIVLGFTSHDRDIRFEGILHRAAPGMIPSAIRRTRGLDRDPGEVSGALAHDSIAETDLRAGLFDGASVATGIVDWETLESSVLYIGKIGRVTSEGTRFQAELQSAKVALETDAVPRTSPTCRASFCDRDCGLNPASYTHEALVTGINLTANSLQFSAPVDPVAMQAGHLRWMSGPHVGLRMEVIREEAGYLTLDTALSQNLEPGMRAMLREGCDRTIATCSARFSNAVNFRGEPFLPGNDMLIRYPTRSS